MAVKPVRLLVKDPTPEPFVVLLSLIVGFKLVEKTTPLAVMAAPPSSDIEPPDVADVWVIKVGETVATLASRGGNGSSEEPHETVNNRPKSRKTDSPRFLLLDLIAEDNNLNILWMGSFIYLTISFLVMRPFVLSGTSITI